MDKWLSLEAVEHSQPEGESAAWIASNTISPTTTGPLSRRRGVGARIVESLTSHCSATVCWRSPAADVTPSITSCRRAAPAIPASAMTKSPAGSGGSAWMKAHSCCVTRRSSRRLRFIFPRRSTVRPIARKAPGKSPNWYLPCRSACQEIIFRPGFLLISELWATATNPPSASSVQTVQTLQASGYHSPYRCRVDCFESEDPFQRYAPIPNQGASD